MGEVEHDSLLRLWRYINLLLTHKSDKHYSHRRGFTETCVECRGILFCCLGAIGCPDVWLSILLFGSL